MTRVGVNAVFLAPGVVSGTATYTWEIVERLGGRAGLDVVVFAQDGRVPPAVAAACEVVPVPRPRSVVLRVAYEQLWLPRVLARHGIEVLWSPGYVGPVWGRARRVVTVHDLYYRVFPAAIPRVRRLYYRVFIPWSARRSDAVIAVSESTRHDLVEAVAGVGPRTVVVHHGAREELCRVDPVPPAPGPPYVLLVAAMTRNKNPAVVVDAVAEVRRRGLDLELRVAGADPFGVLDQTVDAAGAEFVRRLGQVDDAELAGLFRAAAAYVHPSLSEGFGIPILEAQALGVPVIAARSSAVPEVAGAGAVYFDPRDPIDLADRIELLVQAPTERERLVEAGVANVARFSWERAADLTASTLVGTLDPEGPE